MTLKYLSELKNDLASFKNMETDIQVGLAVTPPLVCTHSRHWQLARKNAEDSQERLLLDKIPVVEGAPFDSRHRRHESQCLAKTREQLLDEINRWCRASGGARIYWLSGMAGTGKSTIARKIAHRLAGERILRGSFFFSKGQGDAGNAAKFFTTIAAQLVQNIPKLKPHVSKVITENSHILVKGPGDQ